MKILRFLPLLALLSGTLLMQSCNDELVQEPRSNILYDNAKPEDLLNAAYASLRPYFANGDYWGHSEITTDEAFVPQRGGDWADNGQWTQLHQHTWTPTHPLVNNAWESAYRGIARANDAMQKIRDTGVDSTTADMRDFMAQARFLRAFYYYILVDLYGNVPLLTRKVDPRNYPAQTPRAQVAQFVIDECNTIINDLPLTRPASEYGRITQGAVNMLLAKMYLNANVFQGAGQDRWQQVIDRCDAVINSGLYRLNTTAVGNKSPYLSIFDMALDGAANPEYIFAIGMIASPDQGNQANQWSNHYNFDKVYNNGQSPWNGFTTLAPFYDAYDPDDDRRDIWLIGQQYASDGITKLKYRDNVTDLVYTRDVPVTGATEGQGIRILKWGIDPNATNGMSGNDFGVFRLADAYLMKAEALVRLGRANEALPLVNDVRARSFDPDKPLTTLTLDDILRERGFELSWEAFRRQDLIRFGRFLEPFTNKPQASEPYRLLFPIPQRQIDTNPKLIQNPGYPQ